VERCAADGRRRQGDRVAVLLGNGVAFPMLFAVLRIGAVAVSTPRFVYVLEGAVVLYQPIYFLNFLWDPGFGSLIPRSHHTTTS
jgi:hypothetical protein